MYNDFSLEKLRLAKGAGAPVARRKKKKRCSSKGNVIFLSIDSGVKTETIRKGRIFGGVQGYLEGIFGDPSLTKIQ